MSGLRVYYHQQSKAGRIAFVASTVVAVLFVAAICAGAVIGKGASSSSGTGTTQLTASSTCPDFGGASPAADQAFANANNVDVGGINTYCAFEEATGIGSDTLAAAVQSAQSYQQSLGEGP